MALREKVIGLLLAPAASGIFKRVGSFENAERDDFDHLQQVEVTII